MIEASFFMSPMAANGNPQLANGPQKCYKIVNELSLNFDYYYSAKSINLASNLPLILPEKILFKLFHGGLGNELRLSHDD